MKNVKNPVRITIALDEETEKLLEKIKKESKLSQSEIFRNALRFFSEYRKLQEISPKKLHTYIEMLGDGEHIILDVAHWILFLNLIEKSEYAEEFWKRHEEIALSHADEFSGRFSSPVEILERLEACNFYKLRKVSENEYVLILDEVTKKFVKIFLEKVFSGLGFDVKIKEDLSKLRIKFQ